MFVFFSAFSVLCFRGEMSVSQRGLLWPPYPKQYPISLPIRVLVTNMQRAEWRALKPPSPPNGLAGREWEERPPIPPLTLPAMSCQSLAHWQNPDWKKHVVKGSEGIGRGWRKISPHPLHCLPRFTFFRGNLLSYLMLTFVS